MTDHAIYRFMDGPESVAYEQCHAVKRWTMDNIVVTVDDEGSYLVRAEPEKEDAFQAAMAAPCQCVNCAEGIGETP